MLRFSGVKEGSNGLNEDEIRKSLDLSLWQALERCMSSVETSTAYLEIETTSFNK
jgi:hypothetical protein